MSSLIAIARNLNDSLTDYTTIHDEIFKKSLRKVKLLRNLPEPMEPKDIQDFLGLSKNSTYNLIEEKQFHCVGIGKLYKIPKRSFVKWYLGF